MAVNFRGSVASFATAGLASTPHTLLAINNKAASGLWLAIFEIVLYRDETGVETTITPVATLWPCTAVSTGGTVLSKSRDHADSTRSSSANAEFLGATASDAGAATAITVTLGATAIWRAGTSRMHTLAGAVLVPPIDCMPQLSRMDSTKPLVLASGERVALQLINAGVTGDRNIVDVTYEEWSTATG